MRNVWLSAGLLAVVGCGSPAAQNTGGDAKGKEAAAGATHVDGHGEWCDEHGVAEAECSLCQKAVFKKLKPDEICPEHPDRAKDQCFICNPELWEKSKASYVAKYGRQPPDPKKNMPGKK